MQKYLIIHRIIRHKDIFLSIFFRKSDELHMCRNILKLFHAFKVHSDLMQYIFAHMFHMHRVSNVPTYFLLCVYQT